MSSPRLSPDAADAFSWLSLPPSLRTARVHFHDGRAEWAERYAEHRRAEDLAAWLERRPAAEAQS